MEKSLQSSGAKLVSEKISEEKPVVKKVPYVAPTVTIMDEEEALSAFQATAAGSAMWWVS